MDIATISALVLAAGHRVNLPKKINLVNAAGVAVSHDLAWNAWSQWIAGDLNLILTAFPIMSSADAGDDVVVVDARSALQDLPATYWFVSAAAGAPGTTKLGEKPTANLLSWLGANVDATIAIRRRRALSMLFSLSELERYMEADGTSFRPSVLNTAPITGLTALKAAGEPTQISS